MYFAFVIERAFLGLFYTLNATVVPKVTVTMNILYPTIGYTYFWIF